MKKKNFLFCICLCAACILSGCSVIPRRPSTSNVETFAKTYINESVESAGKKHAEVDCYGKKFYDSSVREFRDEIIIYSPVYDTEK